MDVQNISRSIYICEGIFPNIIRLPKVHFATNASLVLKSKTHQDGSLKSIAKHVRGL